jgi:hypothetical protein
MQGMPGSMGFMQSYDMRAPQAADVLYRSHHPSDSYTPSGSTLPPGASAPPCTVFISPIGDAINKVKDNMRATRATLVTELSTEELSILDGIIPPHLSVQEEHAGTLLASGPSFTGLPPLPQLEPPLSLDTERPTVPISHGLSDAGQLVKEFLDSLSDTEKKLATVKIAILSFADSVIWRVCAHSADPPVTTFDMFSNSENPFKLVDLLSNTLTPEERDSFKVLTELYQSLEATRSSEIADMISLASDYIFLGSLLLSSTETKEKVINYMVENMSRLLAGLQPDIFRSMPPLEQVDVIKTILLESGADTAGMSTVFASVSVVLSRVGWERGANVDTMRQIDMPSDISTMMNAADSFLTPEEATAFRQFLGIAAQPTAE